MKRKFKSSSLFYKWLLVQVYFLVFMTAITVGIYFYTNFHIKKQLNELHMGNLKRMEAEVNAAFSSVIATVNEYTMNPKVRTLTGADLASSEREIAGLIDDIKQTNSTAKGVAEIIIYFRVDDVFISSAGIMDKEIFNEVYSLPVDDEHSMANAILDEDLLGAIVPIFCGRSNTNTAIYSKKFANDIFISAVIDQKQIENILKANQQSELNAFGVFTNKQELLFKIGNDSSIEAIKSLHWQEGNQTQEKHPYICFASTKNGIGYVFAIAEENYLARQLGIQRIAVLMLAVSLVLGLGISYYITRYKYKPVQKVISYSKAVTPKHVFASNENELEQIKSAIEFIYGQKEHTRAVLEKHNAYIKNNAIKMLLDGDVDYKDMTNHAKSLIDIVPSNIYTVAVMDVNAHGEISHEIDRFVQFVPNIKHVISKGGRVIIIFEAKAKEVMEQLSKESFIDTLKGTLAIGNNSAGMDSIKESYNHALLGLSRKILPNAQKVIPPLNKKEAQTIIISTEDEIRLGGMIQSGDTEHAMAMLKELTQGYGINNLNYFSYKSYLFNIFNVILRSAESILGDESIHKLLEVFNASIQKEDYYSISKVLDDAIVLLTTKYKEKMSSGNKRLNESVVRYIDSKIANSQLSSDMIAEAMTLNSAYLRRFFKEQNGIGLWDFINMKRIEMARNLLITTTSSIKNISLSCGYASISTFIRTFKKFSGMTPGHYRNLYR